MLVNPHFNYFNVRFVLMRFHLIFILLLLTTTSVFSQRKCGTVEFMTPLENVEKKAVFENWILQNQIESSSTGLESFNEDNITIYQIPVVVHVVHNGEEIGSGSNISDAQIHSQIEVLNEDFRKLNSDSVNIPSEFKSLYSDIGFEFVLAKRDANNQATTGITRIQGSETSWSLSQDEILKAHDFWPSEDYLNIWVAPLSGGWLGWAQYPETDLLDGLVAPYNAETDGVVITYDAFGSITKDPTANLQSRFNRGRTTTHEVGHYFGLRHIWGDGGCGVDDYVADTPTAEDNYFGCPSLGTASTTCGSQDMFMNFMDYVDDECMHMYTMGQKDRMVIVIENSPRRISLTNSLGLIPPNCEDLAVAKFITPGVGICDDVLAASIEIKNNGTCFINNTNVSLFVNNLQVANQDFNFKLDVNESIELTFDAVTLTEFGNLEFKAIIETVNGNLDGFSDNNELKIISLRAESTNTLFQDFSSPNSHWVVRTNQPISSLDRKQSVFYSISNMAAVFDYYNNENSTDAYLSPKLAVGSSKALLFDYSKSESLDEFAVMVSTDCGNNFLDTLFVSSNSKTVFPFSPVAYYPPGAADWNHVQVDLSTYVNQDVIFAFNGISTGGNRILIDNINVVDDVYNDIALIGLTTPSTLCNAQNETVIWVENKGLQTLVDLNLSMEVGSTVSNISYPQLNLMPGERIQLKLPLPAVTTNQAINVWLTDEDANDDNDRFTQAVSPYSDSYNVPLRERFDTNVLPTDWSLLGGANDTSEGWVLANNRLEFIADASPAKGLKEMIVMPPLNLSELQSASMHFDFAYAFDGFNEELLRVKASGNCGDSFEVLFEQGGEDLATGFSTTSWTPGGTTDWKNIYVDLSDYAGNDRVEVVIEIISAQGNNAFVKNIELYASNIEEPLALDENTITTYPNPSTNGLVNISFNLEKSQPAKLLIYTAQGSFVLTEDITTALNQTYQVQTTNLRNGIYFARLVGDGIDISRSFIVSQ